MAKIIIGSIIFVGFLFLSIFYKVKLSRFRSKIVSLEKELQENKAPRQIPEQEKTVDTTNHSSEYLSKIIAQYHFRQLIFQEIFTELISESVSFESEILSSVLTKFNSIWDSSSKMLEEFQETVLGFISSEEKNSLKTLQSQSENLTEIFTEIRTTLQETKEEADSFTAKNASSYEAIQKINEQIMDLSERLKIISINIRIEAARLGKGNHGFNVLGNEITKFADTTTHFAEQTNNTIAISIQEVRNLQENFESSTADLIVKLQKMGTIIDPFGPALISAFHKFDMILHDLKTLSENIQTTSKQTIGNLQFHDVREQEAIHLVKDQSWLIERGKQDLDKAKVSLQLKEEDKKPVIQDVISYCYSKATTETEIKAIKKLAQKYSVEEFLKEDHLYRNKKNSGTIMF